MRLALPLAGYYALAVLLFPELLPNLRTHILADDAFTVREGEIAWGDSDAFSCLWSYWWVQKALSLLHNPFRCTWVYPPDGVNIFFHNQVLLPTLLTLPAARLLGPVAGYNLMVLLLLAGGAWVYYLFARHGLRLGVWTAAAGGVCFGFAPYFLRVSHCHPNLMGAAFWAGALAVLASALWIPKARRKLSIPFAVCFWASYWSSVGECYMLGWTVLVAVCSYLIFRRSELRRELRSLAVFFLPCAVGALSLLSLFAAPSVEMLSRPVFERMKPAALINPPLLSALGPFHHPGLGVFSSCYVPLSLAILIIVGIRAGGGKGLVAWSTCVGLVMLVFALDPLGFPSCVYRRLPMGGGVRFTPRFFPYALFFLLVPGLYSLRRLRGAEADGDKTPAGTKARTVLLAILIAAYVFEVYPARRHIAPVRRPPIPARILSDLDRSKHLWVLFRQDRVVNDSYQVFFDAPGVEISHLARGREMISDWMKRFPVMYFMNTSRRVELLASDVAPELNRELALTGVAYVFSEDPELAPRLPVRQELLWSGREGCLVAVHPEPPEGPPRETDRDAYIIGPLGEDAPPPEPRR